MDTATVVRRMPAVIYKRTEAIARERDWSAEAVLLNGPSLQFGTFNHMDLVPEAQRDYEDEQPCAMVHQRLAWPQDTPLHQLMRLGQLGQVTNEEVVEMEAWVDLVDHQLLLRS